MNTECIESPHLFRRSRRMIPKAWRDRGTSRQACALALGIWACCGPLARAGDDGAAGAAQYQVGRTGFFGPDGILGSILNCRGGTQAATDAGFYGFGLGYHLGYGYGGSALGVNPDGGYLFYGGPGYPHCWPTLRRCGPITPFPYFG